MLPKKKEPPEEITVRRATLVRLCGALEEIISRLKNQVYWLSNAVEERSHRWRCQGCGHLSHFSKSSSVNAVIPCVKCGSERAESVP